MTKTRRIATGAVSLLSFAAVTVGAAPASAAPQTEAAPAARAAAGTCTGWKNAGGLPLKWTTAKDGCGHFGKPGMKMGYSWKVFKGGSVCIKVKGFNKGKKTWYNAGCGKAGSIKVPWGNVVAEKEMMIKGAALLRWA
ncbi:hypothetical protein [Streptomyces sp. NPDC050856]|uniref:hypothetical protein n=1 Tax=Streptomyces sp. NPDC050856 TaxID=3154939 RepID=UPI0033FF6B8B